MYLHLRPDIIHSIRGKQVPRRCDVGRGDHLGESLDDHGQLENSATQQSYALAQFGKSVWVSVHMLGSTRLTGEAVVPRFGPVLRWEHCDRCGLDRHHDFSGKCEVPWTNTSGLATEAAGRVPPPPIEHARKELLGVACGVLDLLERPVTLQPSTDRIVEGSI